jgi:esterase/lipase superfamily enzyme/lysophospholipase L1-like esterase
MIAGMDVFTEEIEALRNSPAATGRVLLYGSSTVRMWEEFRQDLSGCAVENRGFGGSTLKACADAWELLGKPLRPTAVLLYAGDNDLDQGAEPEDVLESFLRLLLAIQGRRSRRVPVCIVSIKPSPSRWHLLERIRRTNRLLEEACAAHEDAWFLDIVPCMLDGDLRPRRSLFQEDALHLTAKGYRILAEGVSLWLARIGHWQGDLPRTFELAPESVFLPRSLRLHRGPRAGGNDSEIRREYHVWHSPHLGRDMELLVFGHAGERMLVFPSRMERFFEWENRGMIQACRERLEAGTLQLICLDSVETESFFAFGKPPAERIARHWQYERYVLDEVLPFTASRNPESPLGATGCSFGAFHAAAIVFRHPTRFKRLLAMSGRFDLSRSFGEDYPDLFLGYREEPLYYLMPTHFLPGLRDPRQLGALRECEIVLAVGENDNFRQSNDELSRILWQLGIPHAFRLWVGAAHRFRYWRQMARIYLG